MLGLWQKNTTDDLFGGGVMSDFEEYVQRYANCYHISIEEAKTHAIVQEVKCHYEGSDKLDNVWW